jgi:hypothetical protein
MAATATKTAGCAGTPDPIGARQADPPVAGDLLRAGEASLATAYSIHSRPTQNPGTVTFETTLGVAAVRPGCQVLALDVPIAPELVRNCIVMHN